MLKAVSFILAVAVGLSITAAIHAAIPAHPMLGKALGIAVAITLYEPIRRVLGRRWTWNKRT